MIASKRIVIGAEVPRQRLASNGVIKHSANRDAVIIGGLDAEADESTGKHVHDHHHPVAAKADGFAAE